MVISRNDIELLGRSGWKVIVTNGDTTIQKEGGKLIDDQQQVIQVIEEERFEQSNAASKIISQYIIVAIFVLFLGFLISSFF
jgi:hypothetical protein